MQQVGRQHFSVRTAAAVDPRLLPAPLRPQRPQRARPLVGLSHAWVLHGRRITQVFLLACLCAALGIAYLLREDIGEAAGTAGAFIDTELSRAGFGISEISMTGQSLTSETTVLNALGLHGNSSIFSLDAEAARARLEALPSVESATVRKIYPGEVAVTLHEPVAVARWRMDGQTFVVDASGNQIAPAVFDDGELPLVIGIGAGESALPMINLMNRYPALQRDLAALARIGDRRWDLIYYTGLRVQLPETGVAAALARLDAYHRDHQLLDRDVSLIDMRISNAVAVLPVDRDE